MKSFNLFLISLLLLSPIYGLEFVFVRPVFEEGASSGQLRDVLNVDVQGEPALAFEEITNPQTEKIREQLMQSGLVQRVLEMREQALSIRSRKFAPDFAANQVRFPVYVGEVFGPTGPAVASGLRLVLPKSSEQFNALMILSDLKMKGTSISIEAFQRNRYLPAVVAHEIFHAITGDLYGDAYFRLKAASTSSRGHDSHIKTDPFLAWLEGIAEAMEVLAYREHEQEIQAGTVSDPSLSPMAKALLQGFLKRRLKLASGNRFIFDQDGSKLDGVLDSAQDMLRTEGVVAGVFYRLVYEVLEGDMVRAMETMAGHQPQNLLQFVNALATDYPDLRPSIFRCFLENTRYVTMAEEAGSLYRDSYLASKAFKQGRLSREESLRSRNIWKDFRAEVYQTSLEINRIDLAVSKPYIVSDAYGFFEVDLNTASIIDIQGFLEDQAEVDFQQSEVMAQKVLRARGEGNIRDMDDLELPDPVEAVLEEGFQIYRERKSKRLADRAEKLKDGFYSGFAAHEGLSTFLFH